MQLVAINSLLMFDVVFIFFLFLVGVSCLVYYLPQQPRLSPAETDETSYVILSAPTRAKHHAQAPVEEVFKRGEMSGVSVSVAEVLELRAAGLTEHEVWCLLSQLLPELTHRLVTGGITPSTQPLVSLESVHVSGQGRVSLHTTPRHNETSVVLTPKSYDIPTHLLALEKIWVHALGQALLAALHNPHNLTGDRHVVVRTKLMRLLHDLTSLRPSIQQITQEVETEIVGDEGNKKAINTMKSLYREVLGSPPKDLPLLFAENVVSENQSSSRTQIFSSTAVGAITPLTRMHHEPLQRRNTDQALLPIPSTASKNIGAGTLSSIKPGTPLQRRNSMMTRKHPVARSVSSPSNLARDHLVRRNPVHRAPSRLYRPMAPVNKFAGSKYLCPRSCVGPEFVVRSSLPSKEVWVGDEKRVGKKRVLVVLLSGQRLDVLCYPASVTAAQIMEAVVKQEGLTDNFMLGLALLLSGDYVFLPPDTKLNKVAPPSWMLGIHNNTASEPATFTLFVRVQLYLPSLRGVRWEAKHLLYLQLRRCLLEQRLVCPLSQHVAMAGLALQAEFGDFSTKDHNDADYFILDHYIPEDLLGGGEMEEAELRWRLQAQHQTRHGLDPGRAEEAFIAAAQRLPDHGTHYYHAEQVCKEGNTSCPIQLGIKDTGIVVYSSKGSEEGRKLLQSFEWPSIQKLCFSKLFFSLACLSDEGNPLKLKFRMQDKKSFYVFHLASLHHQFSLRLRCEVQNMQTLSREFGIIVSKQVYDSDTEERWSLRSGRQRGSGRTLSHGGLSRQGSCCEEQQNKENECPKPDTDENTDTGSLGTSKRPGVRMGTRAVYTSSQWSSKETLTCEVKAVSYNDHTHSPLPEAYIINASLRSHDEDVHLSYEENNINALTDKIANASMTEERILRTIRVPKDSKGSIGIQVTEGSDGAIYIQSVVPNGSAQKQGIIKRGDQVIAAGSRSLVNLKYHEALQVLQQACSADEGEVELVLSQLFTEDICSKGGQLPSQVTARYRKSRASLFPQSAVRLDIVSTLQKPVEENYLKNIRYETAVESGEMISKLLPKLNSSPRRSPSREYRVSPSASNNKEKYRAVCCVAPATEDED